MLKAFKGYKQSSKGQLVSTSIMLQYSAQAALVRFSQTDGVDFLPLMCLLCVVYMQSCPNSITELLTHTSAVSAA